MGPHELLHFVVEVVYLIQRIVFVLHSAGFGACVGLAFEGERVDDGVVALVAVVERTFGCPPFFFGRVNYNTLKNHPSFANGVLSRLKSRLKVDLYFECSRYCY